LEIYLHGAHVTSWENAGGRQLLFLSRKSLFLPDKPIRGGIPIVFPQFGDGPLPKHGFARIREWNYMGAQSCADECLEAKFELRHDRETLRIWPHEFRLELVFRLGADALEVLFSIHNAGLKEFSFKNGLHTYFAVGDISQARLEGLAGCEFIDFLSDQSPAVETRGEIGFSCETDRVYPMAPDRLVLRDGAERLKMAIEKCAMRDVVVWNPWVEKSKRMEDFGDEEYKKMVCVETGNLHETLTLAPGEIHASSSKFRNSAALPRTASARLSRRRR